MDDRYPTRAWPLRTVVAGQLLGWLRLRTHRLAVSSVASRRSSIDAPCVLARLGSRRPGHHGGYRSTIQKPRGSWNRSSSLRRMRSAPLAAAVGFAAGVVAAIVTVAIAASSGAFDGSTTVVQSSLANVSPQPVTVGTASRGIDPGSIYRSRI